MSRTEGLVQQLPDHPLQHGLSLMLEDGMQQGFRAAYTFTTFRWNNWPGRRGAASRPLGAILWICLAAHLPVG